jgi:hypothetical protein
MIADLSPHILFLFCRDDLRIDETLPGPPSILLPLQAVRFAQYRTRTEFQRSAR